VVARAVFASGRVTYHRIIGGVLLYLTIGLTFVALFGFVVLLVPKTFNNLGSVQGNFAIGNLIYFSFVTLTTIGYGDIVPVHPYARGLANVEAIIGQLYPATLLARLVTLELARRSG
jgi:Ion channel